MSRGQLARDAWANLQYRLNGSTDQQMTELRRRVRDLVAGQPEAKLARLAPEVLRDILPRVYPDMLAAAYAHQDAGRRAYIVTAASQGIANLLAPVFVFDGGIGTRFEVRDGVYTGRLAGPLTYREGKAEAIRQVAEEEGLDLSASYAYSDSESDLPMLRAVGHPVAVNPDRELEQIAREEGWQIMRFDTLGRRLRMATVAGGAAAGVALLGWGGGYLTGRLRWNERWRRVVLRRS